MALYSICNGMDDVNEQDLCVPSLFSVCLGIRFNTSIWNSPSNRSWFPNKGLRRHRVECLFELVFVLVLQDVMLQIYVSFLTLFFNLSQSSWDKGTPPFTTGIHRDWRFSIHSIFLSSLCLGHNLLSMLTYLHDVISQWLDHVFRSNHLDYIR